MVLLAVAWSRFAQNHTNIIAKTTICLVLVAVDAVKEGDAFASRHHSVL